MPRRRGSGRSRLCLTTVGPFPAQPALTNGFRHSDISDMGSPVGLRKAAGLPSAGRKLEMAVNFVRAPKEPSRPATSSRLRPAPGYCRWRGCSFGPRLRALLAAILGFDFLRAIRAFHALACAEEVVGTVATGASAVWSDDRIHMFGSAGFRDAVGYRQGGVRGLRVGDGVASRSGERVTRIDPREARSQGFGAIVPCASEPIPQYSTDDCGNSTNQSVLTQQMLLVATRPMWYDSP